MTATRGHLSDTSAVSSRTAEKRRSAGSGREEAKPFETGVRPGWAATNTADTDYRDRLASTRSVARNSEPARCAIRMLRIDQVIAVTGLSKTRVYVLQAQGDFPLRMQLSSRRVGWVRQKCKPGSLRASPPTSRWANADPLRFDGAACLAAPPCCLKRPNQRPRLLGGSSTRTQQR